MISFAQNGEDVVLERLFRHQLFGRYVDVGAGYPELDSVTKLFYDRGWRGINVEPAPEEFASLCANRSEDVNLQIALSDHIGRIALYLGTEEERGLGTIIREVATSSLHEVERTVDVAMSTLNEIWGTYFDDEQIDFLKIDVEGAEFEVIRGNDWVKHSPRIVVVEATLPNEVVPSHQRWEPILLEAGYRCVLFDGLNRFYSHEDDIEARSLLAAPANAHDRYVPDELHRARLRVQQLEAENREVSDYARRLEKLLELRERWPAAANATGNYERPLSEQKGDN